MRKSLMDALEVDKLIKDIPVLIHHRLFDTKIGACILEIQAEGQEPLLVQTSRGELLQLLLRHLREIGEGPEAQAAQELGKIRDLLARLCAKQTGPQSQR